MGLPIKFFRSCVWSASASHVEVKAHKSQQDEGDCKISVNSNLLNYVFFPTWRRLLSTRNVSRKFTYKAASSILQRAKDAWTRMNKKQDYPFILLKLK